MLNDLRSAATGIRNAVAVGNFGLASMILETVLELEWAKWRLACVNDRIAIRRWAIRATYESAITFVALWYNTRIAWAKIRKSRRI